MDQISFLDAEYNPSREQRLDENTNGLLRQFFPKESVGSRRLQNVT